MSITELRDLISSQVFTLEKAKTRGMMVNHETQRLQNVLMNHVNDIVSALEYAVTAQDTIDRLTVEVENSDAELQDKDDEIKSLKEALEAKKPVGKKKNSVE